jgi:hypothetical protein
MGDAVFVERHLFDCLAGLPEGGTLAGQGVPDATHLTIDHWR